MVVLRGVGRGVTHSLSFPFPVSLTVSSHTHTCRPIQVWHCLRCTSTSLNKQMKCKLNLVYLHLLLLNLFEKSSSFITCFYQCYKFPARLYTGFLIHWAHEFSIQTYPTTSIYFYCFDFSYFLYYILLFCKVLSWNILKSTLLAVQVIFVGLEVV